MSYADEFARQVRAAERAEALDQLHSDFVAYHAEHIAPNEMAVRVGVVSLLAATGTKVDGSHIKEMYFGRPTLSSGFLVAGEMVDDGSLIEMPVVRVESDLPIKLFNSALDKAYVRDHPLTPAFVAKHEVKKLTDLLQDSTISITAGTIRNREPKDKNDDRWSRFTETTNRITRPPKIRGGEYGAVPLPNVQLKRRLFGSVLKGYFMADAPFDTPDPRRLDSKPASELPKLDLTYSEKYLLARNPAVQQDLFEVRRDIAAHNKQVVDILLQDVQARATLVTRGKLGRRLWYPKHLAETRSQRRAGNKINLTLEN